MDGPTSAHRWLAEAAGVWSIAARYWVARDADPIEASGVETVTTFGPYWRCGELELELPGSTVRGRNSVGFDPARQLFVATWLDTANPYLYSYEGRYDEATRLLVLTGTNRDPATRQLALYRSVERFDLPGKRTLELFVQPPGRPEVKVLTYDFRRRD